MSQFLDPKIETLNVDGAEETFTADLTVNRTILENGEAGRVFGFTFANSTNSPAEVTVRDGANKLKFVETVPGKDTKAVPLRFDTAGGLMVDSLAGPNASKVFVNCFYTPGFVS